MRRSIRLNHILIWLFSLLPVVAALVMLSGRDFASAGAVLNTFGRLTGILGLSLLLVAAMLCCRVPGFDRPFGGLTKLWKIHHWLGALAFFLLLLHPLLLALAAVEVSPGTAVAVLFSTRPAVLWGWLALLLMMVFLAPTFHFFGKPEYQRWKWLHRLGGITVVLALIHTFMLSRTLPGFWSIAVWGVFTILALAAIAYRWFWSVWRRRLRYRISAVDHPANNVIELSLEPVARHLRYEAGQFIYLTPYDKALTAGYGEEHPYTLSSAPGEATLRTAIKDLGDASRAIQNITPGTEVGIEGPYGRFFPGPDARPEPELWIAGGIGITPFLARLRHAVQQGTNLNVQLIYCVQDEARVLFREELEQLCQALSQCQLSLHFFYQQGPLNPEFIASRCPDFGSRTVYICGPLSLAQVAREALVSAGLSAGCIVTEEFNLL